MGRDGYDSINDEGILARPGGDGSHPCGVGHFSCRGDVVRSPRFAVDRPTGVQCGGILPPPLCLHGCGRLVQSPMCCGQCPTGHTRTCSSRTQGSCAGGDPCRETPPPPATCVAGQECPVCAEEDGALLEALRGHRFCRARTLVLLAEPTPARPLCRYSLIQ